MAPSTNTAKPDQTPIDDMRKIKQLEGVLAVLQDKHEECADALLSRLAMFNVWRSVFYILVTASLFAGLAGLEWQICASIGAVFSCALISLKAFQGDFELDQIVNKHRQAGVELQRIHKKILSLRTDVAGNLEPSSVNAPDSGALLEEIKSVYTGVAGIPYRTYHKAQKAIEGLERVTVKSADMDSFLKKDYRF